MKGLPEDFGVQISNRAGFRSVERAILVANAVCRYVQRYEKHEPLAEGIPYGSYDLEIFFSLVQATVSQFLPSEMFECLQEEGHVEVLQERGQELYWQAFAQDGDNVS